MRTPRLPRYIGGDMATFINELVGRIEIALTETPSGRPYAVTNPVETRALDVSAATAGDLAEVLGTLIADLKAGGHVG